MAQFRYTALAHDGSHVKGVIEAGDAQEAARFLTARGETPTEVVQSKRLFGLLSEKGPGRAELASFLEDLAALHEAGVPLRRGLEVLSQGDAAPATQKLAKLMVERLDAGADLGTAVRVGEDGDVVLAAEFARAGEQSGRLHDTLRVGASILRRQAIFAQKIQGALAYPLFLLTISVVAIIALSAFAGPALAPLLDQSSNNGGALREIIAFGEFLRSYGVQLAIGVTAFGVLLSIASTKNPLRNWLALLRAHMPFLHPIVRDLNCGAFSRTFGALMTGGAPAAKALDLAASSAPNPAWRAKLRCSADALREGRSVANALASIEGLSPEIAHLARVGEETGSLGQMATRAGDLILDRALDRLDKVAAAAGPVLLVAMGGFIAWMMSAFLTGLSSLGDFAL
jgi:general secretion pathway protein F